MTERVPRANDEAELTEILHRSISGLEGEQTVLLPCSFDLRGAGARVLDTLGRFYANLEGYTCTATMAPGRDTAATFAFRYRIGKVKLAMMQSAVEKKVAELAALLFRADMPSAAKAYIAHNYLARRVAYWRKEEANPLECSYMQSAYGALINGKCVCRGYAEAYSLLLASQNIPCDVVCGSVAGESDLHAWNIVGLGGGVYRHVDVTWDCVGGGEKTDEYFGKTDAEMLARRSWTRAAYPACAGGKNVLSEARTAVAMHRGEYIAGGVPALYLT